MSILRLHEMANVELLEKRRMKQLMCTIYDIVSVSTQPRVILQNTRIANKNNVELEVPNTQLYSNSPYYVGGQIWNNLSKITQEQKTKANFKRIIVDVL